MPPKEKKHGKKGGGDLVNEDKLQAIVLSDSYQTRFMPLTAEKPRCLLPLANTPLIEYTLEFLATAGVGDVYVVCCSLSDMVEEYVKKSKWNGPGSPFRVYTILAPESSSVGDVMRDLDTKGLIRGDFLLISGDVVCNMDFQKVLDEHNERKAKDKNAIMTMVLREGSALHRTRQRTDPGLFVLDQENGRCLRYETAKETGAIALDAEVLEEHDNIAFRNDLIDCQIDICTPDVPALFQENFDYDHIRQDFVKGILTSDLLGKTIYTHLISKKYGARVQSAQTYDAVSRDIISRYTYPIVPDSNLVDDQTFNYQLGHIYKENGVVLAQSCHIESGTVIGADTFIGGGSRISKSVIGRRCKIGENVVLDGAYIWDDVVIEDNVTIKQAIVADKAIIKSHANIEPGAVISFNVVIGHGRTIQGNMKVTLKGDDDDDFTVVGEDGQGMLYYESEVDQDDESSSASLHKTTDGLVYSMEHLYMSDTSIISDDEEAQRQRTKKQKHKRAYSTNSAAAFSDVAGDDSDEDEDFISEAVASINRSIEENHALDVAVLELNTLRMTMNASYEEVREATMTSLVGYVVKLINLESFNVKDATKKVFVKYAPMIAKQIFEYEDQVHLLQSLQEQCARRPQGGKIFIWAVDTLYDRDILDEDYITQWWDSTQSQTTSKLVTVRQEFQPWYTWLKTADEDDSSEDSEELDSDDD
ncbi:hypothetical protein TRICI_002237 [Trichomonascus ciferrii]|uniref:Translation initiation factor eIF2B subunit epsilon n=1 Tax=Trichomonascus ciferrii TaxID=44093 RepID=A0A642V8K4_9ASCO|nr:hypothetical protein TRICI_002237 [Trichomonascus ciferrii]